MPQHFTRTSSHELGALPEDNVIIGDIKDETLAPLPTYQDLYHRWEKQQWRALDIDFRMDCLHWAEVPLESRAFLPLRFVIFFPGEVSVKNPFFPYFTTMPTQYQRLFLT